MRFLHLLALLFCLGGPLNANAVGNRDIETDFWQLPVSKCIEQMAVFCGELEVPSQYNDVNSKKLKLAYYLLPTLGKSDKILVMLPGGPGMRGDYLVKSALAQKLRQVATIVVLDSRGAPSTKNLDHYYNPRENNVANMVEDIRELQDGPLNGSKISLYGHSFGGTLATLFAGRYPRRVERLICQSCAGDFSSWAPYLRHYFSPRFGALDLLHEKYPDAAELSEIETRYQQLEVLAGKAKLLITVNGEKVSFDPINLRNYMFTGVHLGPKQFLKYVKAFETDEKWLSEQLAESYQWNVRNDNYRYRQFLICTEILSKSELSAKVLGGVNTWADYYGCDLSMNRLVPINFEARQGAIKAPVLLLGGSKDAIVPFEVMLNSFRGVRQKAGISIEGVTHYGYNEEPDISYRLISGFLY